MQALFIGDSMAEGLERPLRAALSQQGYSLTANWKRGTTTMYWRNASINASGYDIVLIALGTNDAYNSINNQASADAALDIINKLGGVPHLWIGQPGSVKDNGTPDALASVSNYFDSRNIPMTYYDGVHPTAQSFSVWARHIADYIAGGNVQAAQPAFFGVTSDNNLTFAGNSYTPEQIATGLVVGVGALLFVRLLFGNNN